MEMAQPSKHQDLSLVSRTCKDADHGRTWWPANTTLIGKLQPIKDLVSEEGLPEGDTQGCLLASIETCLCGLKYS